MDIYEQSEKIKSQKDFILFLEALKKDFQNNKEEWENGKLEQFLEGLYGYCMDKEQEELSWKVVAELLLAAKVYE